jgi:hypothetical protein
VIGFQLLVCDLRRGPTGDWDEELRELGVSDPIIAMFKQCIARQARRYPHAGALADELQNLIDSKPSTAAKPALPVPPKISANPVDALVGLAAIAPPQIPFNKEIERPTEKRSKKTQSNLSNDKEPISPNENLTEKVIAAIFIGIIISIALSGILFFAISARRHAEEQRLADIKKREAAEIASAQQENIKKSIELENEKTINQKIDKLKSKIVGAWKSADNNLFVEFTNNTFIFSSVSHKINNETKTIKRCGLQNGALTLGPGYWALLVDFVSDNEISISNDIGKTEIFGLLQGKFSRSDSEEIKKLYKLSAEKSGKNNRTNSIMPNSGNLFPPGGFPGQSAPSEPPLTPPGVTPPGGP